MNCLYEMNTGNIHQLATSTGDQETRSSTNSHQEQYGTLSTSTALLRSCADVGQQQAHLMSPPSNMSAAVMMASETQNMSNGSISRSSSSSDSSIKQHTSELMAVSDRGLDRDRRQRLRCGG